MTELQEKLLELLTDIDHICSKAGIRYYLCAETAHAAFMRKGFYPNCCQASVAMTTDDALKFIAAVQQEGRADRLLDSMDSNRDYPDFTLRYGDPNTLFMELPYAGCGAVPCIGVTIHMIRRRPKRFGRVFRLTRAFWKACCRPVEAFDRPALRFAVQVCHGIKALFGKALSRGLFRSWCAMFSRNTKAKKLSVCAGKYVFDADLLEQQDVLELEGRAYRVFGYVDSYLAAAYGPEFREVTPKYLTPSGSLLVSCHVPCQAYLERARELKVDYAAIRANKGRYDALQKKVRGLNKVIDGYYAIVDRTEKRFAMYETYMPMKKLLLKLHSEGDFETLRRLLQPYMEALEACYRRKMGLCFDPEIFDITMELLRADGQYTYANKLRALVPKQHFAPMTVTDYKGQLLEIADISQLPAGEEPAV